MTRSNEISATLKAAGIEDSDLDRARATTEKLLGDYTPTTDLILDAYLRIHGRSKQVRGELSRWFEEFSRQEREAALKDLENGVLPEGYMIVNVENLSEAVLRARKGIVTEAEALKFAAEFLRSKRFHAYKSQSGVGWIALNTIGGATRALEAEAKLRS